MINNIAQGASAGAMFGPWGAAIGAGIGAIGGLLGGRSSRRAAEAQRRAREQQAGVYRQVGDDIYGAYGQYGEGLGNLAGTVDERFAFTPVAARSGFGTASYGPDGFSATLSPEYQGVRDQMLGGGANMLSSALGFNRDSYAQDYYGKLQSLQAPSREQTINQVARRLNATGTGGLMTNAQGNPQTYAMMKAFAEQDQNMAFQADQMASNRWNQDLARAQGMITGAGGIDQYAQMPFNMFQAGQQMRQPYDMAGNAMWYGLNQGALQAPLSGTIARGDYQTRAADILAGGQINYAAQRNAANQGMIGGFTNFMTNLPWGQMGGMFGGGPQIAPQNPVNMFPGSPGTFAGY